MLGFECPSLLETIKTGMPWFNISEAALVGGGGAGGSIRIEGSTITLGAVSALGGSSTDAYGYGGQGRVAIYYSSSFSNSTTICAQASTYCQDTDSSVATPTPAMPTVTPTLAAFTNPDSTGLVSWWRLNEASGTRFDSHGTNHLADNNAVGRAAPLATDSGNYSASFVSTSRQFLMIADNPSISTGDVDFTLVANVYLNSTTSSAIIVDKSDNATSYDYRISYIPGLGFRFRGGTGNAYVDSGDVSPNAWYTVIAWHDSFRNTINIQVNNGVVNSVSHTTGTTDTANPLSIGALSDGTVGFNGRVDELALYKRVFTFAERSWFYNNGAGRVYPEINPTASNPGVTNLVAWWRLDETSGIRYDTHGDSDLTSNNTVGYGTGLKGNAASFTIAATPANQKSLSAPDSASLSTGNIDFTLVANVYLSSTSGNAVIIDKSDNASAYDYRIAYNPGTGFRFRVGSGDAYVDSGDVPPNAWHTVIAWHNAANNTINIQVNNGTPKTVPYSAGTTDTTRPLSIGALPDGGAGLNGRLDEVAFYKRVLSAAERTWLYNDGKGRMYSEVNSYVGFMWQEYQYKYSASIPHAVTSVNRGSFTDSFAYDENGNMTCRTESGVTYIQTYNAENRIASIQKLASGTCSAPGNLVAKWDFTYDGDGVRTAQLYSPYENGQPGSPVLTRYYFGGAFETKGGTWKKYYSFAGQTVAMRDETGLKYFLTDHLGSIVTVMDGTTVTQQRYMPFGQVRTDIGSILQTDFGYTSQRKLDDGMGGIMDYKARFYSPYRNHAALGSSQCRMDSKGI
jgi:hypothetical protein